MNQMKAVINVTSMKLKIPIINAKMIVTKQVILPTTSSLLYQV